MFTTKGANEKKSRLQIRHVYESRGALTEKCKIRSMGSEKGHV